MKKIQNIILVKQESVQNTKIYMRISFYPNKYANLTK